MIAATVPLGVITGAAVTLAIRPEHVEVTSCERRAAAAITGRVATRSYLGDSALLEVEVNGVTSRQACRRYGLGCWPKRGRDLPGSSVACLSVEAVGYQLSSYPFPVAILLTTDR